MIEPQLKKQLRKAVWDYNIPEEELVDIFEGRSARFSLDQDRLRARLLLSTPWYSLLGSLGVDGLRSIMTKKAIGHIRIRDVREKFLTAKDILDGGA